MMRGSVDRVAAARHGRRAMTMVEIVIAGLILAVGVLPMLSTLMSGSREARVNRNRNYAASVAVSILERHKPLAASVLDHLGALKCKDAAQKIPVPAASKYEPPTMQTDELLFASPTTQPSPGDPEFYIKEYKDFVKDHFQCYLGVDKIGGSQEAPLYSLVVKVCWKETNAAGITTTKVKAATASGQDQELMVGTIVGAPYYPNGHKE